ncbi:MAG TPA: helix-turn-helix domain-containing protein [Blastocatellia bacterium]|nr:helix-turn-helix domain-containing protein [Blastocatellia bacterium]
MVTGEEIRRLRGKESQAEFAHRLGVSASTVCRWEASETRPSPLALRSLLKFRKREPALSKAGRL